MERFELSAQISSTGSTTMALEVNSLIMEDSMRAL